MNARLDSGGSNTFLVGLIMGGVIGAALAIAFAPEAGSELRERVRETAADLGNAASRGYQEASGHLAGVVNDAAARGQAMRDDVADAVGRGAREVEQFAMASKTSGSRRS